DAPGQAEAMYHLVEHRVEEKTVELLTKEPAKTATLIELVVSDESEQADKQALISSALADSDTDTEFVGPVQAVSTEVATLTEPLPNNTATQQVAEPQIEASSEPSLESPAIVDDATEADAKYSIQVGMYSSSANAAAREQLLREAGLSAYSQAYLNSNDENRYNVRFGYFASKERAQQALDAFQQQFSANGFIVRFKR
ncbi:MAG: SPOR domain-containing protein, partial [Gammaproteobacteria bacterium]|nr:SPOR domain-containing protein [Gammaproteobacteria bacterium]